MYWVSTLAAGSKDIPTENANEKTVFSFSLFFYQIIIISKNYYFSFRSR